MEITPIQPRTAARSTGLVLAAEVSGAKLDERLTALAPLHRALGGAVMLLDDGSLTGADRVRAARACGDPAFLAPGSIALSGFPASPEWALLLAALEGRRNGYWIVSAGSRPLEPLLPALARAIASNRSFALLDDAVPKGFEPYLETLAKEGWRYLRAAPDLIGFAAGGDGALLAAAILARLEAMLGTERARCPDMAGIAANFVLARERDPVLMRDKPGTVHSPNRI